MEFLNLLDKLLSIQLSGTLAGLALAAATFLWRVISDYRAKYEAEKTRIAGGANEVAKRLDRETGNEMLVNPANEVADAGNSFLFAFAVFAVLALAQGGLLDTYMDRESLQQALNIQRTDASIEAALATLGGGALVNGARIIFMNHVFGKLDPYSPT